MWWDIAFMKVAIKKLSNNGLPWKREWHVTDKQKNIYRYTKTYILIANILIIISMHLHWNERPIHHHFHTACCNHFLFLNICVCAYMYCNIQITFHEKLCMLKLTLYRNHKDILRKKRKEKKKKRSEIVLTGFCQVSVCKPCFVF